MESPHVIHWVAFFRSRRSFQMSVNGSPSEVAEAVSGVTQGSVLGPTLFVIFANDFAESPTIDHLVYADDVKLIDPENKRLPSKTSPNGPRTVS